MQKRPDPRIIRHSCPKCKVPINVTVQREGAERHPAKCGCGWEGFVKEAPKYTYPPRRKG